MPPNCRKIFALWPPTEENNRIFYRTWGQRVQDTKGNRIIPDAGPLLKQCQIALTRENESLYIPAGWIHSVLTLAGPGLIGQSYILANDLLVSIECLWNEFDNVYREKDILETFTAFAEAFSRVLNPPIAAAGLNKVQGEEVNNEAESDLGSKGVNGQDTNSIAKPDAEEGSKAGREQVVNNNTEQDALSKGVDGQGTSDRAFWKVWKMLKAIAQVNNDAEPEAGSKGVDGQVRNSNAKPDAEEGSKEGREQEVNNDAKLDARSMGVDGQDTNSNANPDAEEGSKEGREQEVNNDAKLDAGPMGVDEQDTNNHTFWKVWKVLEAIAHLALRKYPKGFRAKVNILNSAVKNHFNAYIKEQKPYPCSRCPMCPMCDGVLSDAKIFLDHFQKVHTIKFDAS